MSTVTTVSGQVKISASSPAWNWVPSSCRLVPELVLTMVQGLTSLILEKLELSKDAVTSILANVRAGTSLASLELREISVDDVELLAQALARVPRVRLVKVSLTIPQVSSVLDTSCVVTQSQSSLL